MDVVPTIYALTNIDAFFKDLNNYGQSSYFLYKRKVDYVYKKVFLVTPSVPTLLT